VLAANLLFRCFVSVEHAAFSPIVIRDVGFEVVVAAVRIMCSPALWLVLLHGAKWRDDDVQEKAE